MFVSESGAEVRSVFTLSQPYFLQVGLSEVDNSSAISIAIFLWEMYEML
jgi:hypothetical protein